MPSWAKTSKACIDNDAGADFNFKPHYLTTASYLYSFVTLTGVMSHHIGLRHWNNAITRDVLDIQFLFQPKCWTAPDIATGYFTVSITALQCECHRI